MRALSLPPPIYPEPIPFVLSLSLSLSPLELMKDRGWLHTYWINPPRLVWAQTIKGEEEEEEAGARICLMEARATEARGERGSDDEMHCVL